MKIFLSTFTLGVPIKRPPVKMERNLWVHNEILLEAPIEATDEVALTLKKTMEEAESVFLKIVPVEAEVVIADSWAEK